MNINEAIECAQDGDVIHVWPGEVNVTWSEAGVGATVAGRAMMVPKWESGPHQYRLMHKRTGAYVLQGSFHVWELNCPAIEWRDLPTVEEAPEKPKNDWARPTKWGGRV